MRADVRLAFFVVCAAILAEPAAAQGTGAGDSAPIQLGAVGITPTLVVKNLGVDDNVYNEPVDQKSDFTFTISPGVEITYKPRWFTLAYTGATEYVYYKQESSQRGTNGSSRLSATVELALLRLWGSANGSDTRERATAEIDERARRHETQYIAGAGFHLGSKTLVGAAARRQQRTYDSGETFRGQDLGQVLNSRIDAIDAQFTVDLTPFTQFSGIVTHERERFDSAPERNSRTLRVSPTFTFSPGGLLAGSLMVGYRQTTGDTALLPTFKGLAAGVNVTATTADRVKIATVFTRDLRYSYERVTPYYVTTGISETVTTLLPARFDLVGSGGYQDLAYRALHNVGDAPSDKVKLVSGGVGYRPRDRIRIGATAEWSRRDSPRDFARTYRNRRIFATLSWGTLQ